MSGYSISRHLFVIFNIKKINNMNKLSYALGMSLGQSLQASGVTSLEFDDFLSGVKVIFSGDDTKISAEYGNKIIQTFFDKKKKEEEEAEKIE